MRGEQTITRRSRPTIECPPQPWVVTEGVEISMTRPLRGWSDSKTREPGQQSGSLSVSTSEKVGSYLLLRFRLNFLFFGKGDVHIGGRQQIAHGVLAVAAAFGEPVFQMLARGRSEFREEQAGTS